MYLRDNFKRLNENLVSDIQRYGIRLDERNSFSDSKYITDFIYSYENKTYLITKENGEVIIALEVK